LTINIQPVEVDGKYFVSLTMDGQPIGNDRGPVSSPDEAEALAYQLASWCRTMVAEVVVTTATATAQTRSMAGRRV
jgi:hypothetical protein